MTEDARISGSEPDLTTEEYMKLFNRAVNDGEELKYYLPAVKDLTPEQLVDHINLINQFAVRIKVVKQAVKKTLEERKIDLSKEQRDALKLRDQQYKPKAAAAASPSKPRRAAGTAKTQDAIESIMNLLGLTREQAEKKLAKIQTKLETTEEQS